MNIEETIKAIQKQFKEIQENSKIEQQPKLYDVPISFGCHSVSFKIGEQAFIMEAQACKMFAESLLEAYSNLEKGINSQPNPRLDCFEDKEVK